MKRIKNEKEREWKRKMKDEIEKVELIQDYRDSKACVY